jgi:hypothetical protein
MTMRCSRLVSSKIRFIVTSSRGRGTTA